MLRREDQIHLEPSLCDIVRAKIKLHPISGRMNSYNKMIEYKEFEGYAIVLNMSETFTYVYLPNRTTKLLKTSELVVVSKWKQN